MTPLPLTDRGLNPSRAEILAMLKDIAEDLQQDIDRFQEKHNPLANTYEAGVQYGRFLANGGARYAIERIIKEAEKQ